MDERMSGSRQRFHSGMARSFGEVSISTLIIPDSMPQIALRRMRGLSVPFILALCREMTFWMEKVYQHVKFWTNDAGTCLPRLSDHLKP